MEAIIRINIDNELNEPDKPYTATVSVETGANWSLADEREYKLEETSNADLLNKIRDMLAGRAAEALVEDLTYDLMWMDDKAWHNGVPVDNYTAEKPEPEPEPTDAGEQVTLEDKLEQIREAVSTHVPAEGYAILQGVTMGDIKTPEDMQTIAEMRKALYIAEPEELEKNLNYREYRNNAIAASVDGWGDAPAATKQEYKARLTAVAWGLDALNHTKYMGLGRRLFYWPRKA